MSCSGSGSGWAIALMKLGVRQALITFLLFSAVSNTMITQALGVYIWVSVLYCVALALKCTEFVFTGGHWLGVTLYIVLQYVFKDELWTHRGRIWSNISEAPQVSVTGQGWTLHEDTVLSWVVPSCPCRLGLLRTRQLGYTVKWHCFTGSHLHYSRE